MNTILSSPTKVIGSRRELRDHPEHDDVVQPVGGPQQELHGLQLEPLVLRPDILPVEEVVSRRPLLQQLVSEG